MRLNSLEYKTQYEELKVQHDLIIAEKEKLIGDLATETAAKEALATAAASVHQSTSESEASLVRNQGGQQPLAMAEDKESSRPFAYNDIVADYEEQQQEEIVDECEDQEVEQEEADEAVEGLMDEESGKEGEIRFDPSSNV